MDTINIKIPKIRRRQVIIATFIVAGLIICGIGGYAVWQINKQSKEIVFLKSQLSDRDAQLKKKEGEISKLNDEKSTALIRGNRLEDEKKTLEQKMTVGYAALIAVASSFDDLDTLVLTDDKRNRTDIEWYTDNGQWDVESGTLAAARYRYSTWPDHMSKSDAEYKRIKAEVTTSMDELSDLLDYINILKTDTTQTQ